MCFTTGFYANPFYTTGSGWFNLGGDDLDWADTGIFFSPMSLALDGGLFSNAIVNLNSKVRALAPKYH